MHNHLDKHPAKTQQKALFQRRFYALALDKHLDLLYKNCYRCSIIQKLPKEILPDATKTDADSPHSHFHADIIKRAKQNILTVKDHFTSCQDAIFVNSEKANDLRDGLISITTALRKPSRIYITVDNSPGFASLIKENDQTLAKHMITLIKTDAINKNGNAVIDRGCRELEEEIKRFQKQNPIKSQKSLKSNEISWNPKNILKS